MKGGRGGGGTDSRAHVRPTCTDVCTPLVTKRRVRDGGQVVGSREKGVMEGGTELCVGGVEGEGEMERGQGCECAVAGNRLRNGGVCVWGGGMTERGTEVCLCGGGMTGRGTEVCVWGGMTERGSSWQTFADCSRAERPESGPRAIKGCSDTTLDRSGSAMPAPAVLPQKIQSAPGAFRRPLSEPHALRPPSDHTH
eukprot:352201-Chlamydomonas_euryale.AAC.1